METSLDVFVVSVEVLPELFGVDVSFLQEIKALVKAKAKNSFFMVEMIFIP